MKQSILLYPFGSEKCAVIAHSLDTDLVAHGETYLEAISRLAELINLRLRTIGDVESYNQAPEIHWNIFANSKDTSSASADLFRSNTNREANVRIAPHPEKTKTP